MSDEQKMREGRVDRATTAMREMTVPAGPSENQWRDMIEKIAGGAGDVHVVRTEKEWWKMKIVRRSAAAAGLVGIVSAGLMWLVWGRTAQVAFADVIDQMKKVQAVRCTVTAEMGAGTKPITEQMLMVDPGWIVTEIETPSVKVVLNQTEGKMLTLIGGSTKEAMLVDLAKVPPEQRMPSMLDQFKIVGRKDAKAIGEKEIGGVKTKGFDVVSAIGNSNSHMEVWADVTTDRPVLVVMKFSVPMMGMGSETRYTFSDFNWKPQYDPAELSFKVPEGYTVQTANLDMSAPTEGDVVTMLKTFGEMNGGMFPDGLGKPAFKSVLMKWMKDQQAPIQNRKTPSAMMPPGMMDKAAAIGRGRAYMMLPKKGTDWEYAGAGVKVGEKGRVVLWYKSVGGTALRGFDADFTVHEVTAAALPAGEPVNLDVVSPGIPK